MTKAMKGFYKLQTRTQQSSSIMDKSVYTAVSNIEKSYQLWERANDKTGKSIFDNSKKIESYKDRIKVLDEEIKKSEKTLADIEKQSGKNSKEAEQYNSHVLDLKLSHSQLTEEMRRAERETRTFTGRLELLEREFTRINNRYRVFDKVGGKFQEIGNKLTMGVTLPLVAVGTVSAKSAMDFEKGMTKANTIAKLSSEEIKNLSKETLNLSDATGVTAKDLAEMEYNALSASVKIKDLTSVVKTSSELSKGGFADANDSLKLLTSTYNIYREEFEKLGISQANATKIIADKMINIQNMGVTTVGQLSSTLGSLTPIASNAGLSLDELSASMIVLTKNGLSTGEATTGLKATLSNLIKPSQQARKMAQALGIDFSTATIKSKGFGGFLKDLREKLKNTNPALIETADKIAKYHYQIDHATKEQKKNKEQMRHWKAELKNAKGQLKVLTKAGGETTGALGQLFGSVEGLGAVLSLTSKYGMEDFKNGLEASKNSIGSTQKAADQMAETTAEKFEKAMNKLKNAGIRLGIKLLPVVEKGINLISNLADKFGKLSPTTQDWIVKIGLATAVLGPFLSVTGGVIKGIGGLLSLGPKVSTFFGLFKGATTVATAVEGVGTAAGVATGAAGSGGILGLTASFGPAVVAAAPWIAAAGAVAYGGHKIYKHMTKEAIPAVDLFANKTQQAAHRTKTANGQIIQSYEQTTIKISDETKKAVGTYMELDKSATESLTNIYANRTILTNENSQELISIYKNMNKQIEKGIDKHYQKRTSSLQNFFNNSNAMTKDEEAEILAKEKQNNEARKASQQEFQDKIKAIIERASKENRNLKADEVKEINMYQNNMRQNAIKCLSEEEIESKVIMERLKGYSSRITAEQASEVIKNAEKQRISAVDKANKQYDETVKQIIRMRDETGTITAEQADKLIKEAERQKTQSIEKANMLKEGVVTRVLEMDKTIADDVDTKSGEMLTSWDKLKKWWDDWKPDVKNFTFKVTGFFEKINSFFEKQNDSGLGTYNGPGSIAGAGKGYATGTNSATPGLHEIAEDGFEIVTSRQYRWFNGGEKVFNHNESKKLLEALSNKSNAQNIAKEAMAQSKESIAVKPRVSVSESTIKNNNASMLNYGDKNKKAYKDYVNYVNKLNQDEVKTSKELLDKDYKNRIIILDAKIKAIKESTAKETANLQAVGNKKNEHNKKAIAAVKSVTNAKVKALENSKTALKKYHELGIELLNERNEAVKKSIKTSENLFKDKINKYDVAIRRLSIDTKDLNKNLDNQKAIVIIQEQKIGELKKRYKELAESFGSTSDEAIEAKKAFQDAKIELISMSNAVVEAKKQINKEVAESINNLADKIKNALKEKYSEEESQQEESLNKQLDNLEKLKNKNLEEINEVFDKKKEILQEEENKSEIAFQHESEELDKWKKDTLEAIEDTYNTKKEALENGKLNSEKAFKYESEKLDNWKEHQLRSIDEVSNKKISALQDQINALDKQVKVEERIKKDKEDLIKINRLKDKISFEHNEFNKAEMQKELNKLIQERQERLHNDKIEDTKDTLKKQMDIIKEDASKQKQSISDIYETKKDNLKRRIDDSKEYYRVQKKLLDSSEKMEKDSISATYEAKKEDLKRRIVDSKEYFAKQKKQLQETEKLQIKSINETYNFEKAILYKKLRDNKDFYEKKLDDAQLNAEAEKLIMDNNQKEIVELLKAYGDTYKEVGNTLGENLVEGFKPKIDSLREMVADINSSISESRKNALKAISEANAAKAASSSHSFRGSTHISNNHSTVVNNNHVTFNSPHVMRPSEIMRKTESTFRRLVFGS
ncbi:phage tail tape measure protein [Clostridium ganghwense]|uniref:Phage tail tape measure protein n=1 Tax=Clostridium ganghwense TaxID=312089 RepID=A0ABT4CU67_9CLOT|nr:phage tail tape measure protein [Clostridium ganghwense]